MSTRTVNFDPFKNNWMVKDKIFNSSMFLGIFFFHLYDSFFLNISDILFTEDMCDDPSATDNCQQTESEFPEFSNTDINDLRHETSSDDQQHVHVVKTNAYKFNKVHRFETDKPELTGSENQETDENINRNFGVRDNGDDNDDKLANILSKQNEGSNIEIESTDRSQSYKVNDEVNTNAFAKLDDFERENDTIGMISSFLVGNWLQDNFKAIMPVAEHETDIKGNTGSNNTDEENKFGRLTRDKSEPYLPVMDCWKSDSGNKGENSIVHAHTQAKCVTLHVVKKRVHFSFCIIIFEPRDEKTGFLHMRKQRRRSASR